jgi:hypothetical protein
MKKSVGWLVPLVLLAAAALAAAAITFPACRGAKNGVVIITAKNPSPLETLAAKEVRRYFYLRTGLLAPIESRANLTPGRRNTIAVLAKSRLGEASWVAPELRQKAEALGAEEYLLKTVPRGRSKVTLIIGGDDIGTLYAAYRFAEALGVRFYLHGDVIPDPRAPAELPAVDETGKPLFRLRGIHPFHDFPEGPDWWNRDDYLAVIGQLPKLRLNFIGLHTYPEGRPNAEPTVWIGRTEDIGKDGAVRFAYPSSYQNTLRGNWGYEATRTSDFHFGAAELFDRDDYGADVMGGFAPEPKTPEGSEEVFRRTGLLLRDAFTFGRKLGVKSCVGTEMPLTIPELVKKRLRDQGQDLRDPSVVAEIYKGIFERIKETYPLDYYWLWTDENWTWSDASGEQITAVVSDAKTAVAAAAEVGAPFSLATCGWVLGPPSDRTLFDRELPKNVAASCINREVGKAPVDPMFARIAGRSKWAIPWLEDDPSLTSPQLWAGRMRKDAMDALAYGCDGLLGIHWRTRVLGPNISALAKAAWDQKSWSGPAADAAGRVEGPLNGVFVTLAHVPPTAGPEAAVYRDYRDRVYGYRLAIPNGKYEVTLKFIEGEMKAKAARVFDVSIQGKKVLEKLDIFARAGQFQPLDLRFAGIDVADGTLAIEFADRIHYPAIAGIVVRGKDLVRKINCGGPRQGDYEADWPESPRFAPVADFYADWAASEFGPAAGQAAGALFSRIDGRLPQINVWTGPGGLKPDPRPWADVEKDYGFVDELAALRPEISGKGSEERFGYWLNTFLYMREAARLECLWGEYEKAAAPLKKPGDAGAKAALAEKVLVPIRERLAECVKTLYGHLLATVSNSGELGTVANWEQHLIPSIILKPNEDLAKILGRELPAAAGLPRSYGGPPRLIVPAARTLLATGEPLDLKVIILAAEPPTEASLFWRPLGREEFQSLPLVHIARGVYGVTCPETARDLEYYLKARVGDEEVFFPAAAPALCQTAVRAGD